MKSVLEYRDRRFALVVVDVQRKFVADNEGLRESVDRRIGRINEAVSLFREADEPIVYVYFDGSRDAGGGPDEDLLVEGLLPMRDADIEVHKGCMNAFNGTGLAEMLRSRGVDAVVIAGLVAHYCVLATYFGAFDHGICPYILEGGVAATEEENAEMVERMFKTLSPRELWENRRLSLRTRSGFVRLNAVSIGRYIQIH